MMRKLLILRRPGEGRASAKLLSGDCNAGNENLSTGAADFPRSGVGPPGPELTQLQYREQA